MPRRVPHKGVKVVFRDGRGRFLPQRRRYDPDVKMIQVVRRKKYLTVAKRSLPPQDLPNVLNQREFESLPEALVRRADVQSGRKYKAWDVAKQIDAMPRLRRKDCKYTITIQDGNRRREISFYHRIKRNGPSSYQLFRRINQEVGIEGFFLYDRTPGGKILADRKGKQVQLINVRVEEVL